MQDHIGFIYELPMLKHYAFNEFAQCLGLRSNKLLKVITGYTNYEKRWRTEPHYYLELDDGTKERIFIKEIQQYIKHCQLVHNFYNIQPCAKTY